MKTFDEVKGFIDYTNEEEWNKYSESLVRLWKESWIIIKFWEMLCSEFNGISFDEINEKDIPLILGGLSTNGYTKNSNARFFCKYFGMGSKDIQSIILQNKTKDKITDVKIEVQTGVFMVFVKEIFSIIDLPLRQHFSEDFKDQEINYEKFKEDENQLIDVIKSFYKDLLDLSRNCNYGTFFICSVDGLTFRYMKEAYPRIEKCMDLLENKFGLSEIPWADYPILPSHKLYKEYKIYGFSSNSLGATICKLNDAIWRNFNNNISLKEVLKILFGDVPDLKTMYIDNIRPYLQGDIDELIRFNWISAHGEWYSKSGKTTYESKETTLMELLDRDAQFIFLGISKLSNIGSNYISFKKALW